MDERAVRCVQAAWQEYRHGNFGGVRGSNWVGVCRAGELMLILGSRRDELWPNASTTWSVSTDASTMGTPSSVSVGRPRVYGYHCASSSRPPWRSIGRGRSPRRSRSCEGVVADGPYLVPAPYSQLSSGRGSPRAPDQGFASLLFALTPEDELGRQRFWYDRHCGVLSQQEPGEYFVGTAPAPSTP